MTILTATDDRLSATVRTHRTIPATRLTLARFGRHDLSPRQATATPGPE
ncbi:hypothetical protein [Streptodolium elevatio]